MPVFDLPAEIWIIIFTALSEEPLTESTSAGTTPQSLLSISAVSQLFHVLVRPLLFRQMTFSLMSPAHLDRSSAALRALEQNPETNLFVHRLHIVMWKKTVFDVAQLKGRPSAYQRLVKIFPRMKNLRWLKIDHSTVNTEMYDHLYHLPFLIHFECWNVLFQQRETPYPSPSMLRLNSLTMYNVHHGDQYSIEAISRLSLAPTLRHLHYSNGVAPILFNLHIYATMSSGIPSLPHLTTLDGPGPSGDQSADHFSKFLAACPSLTSIVLSRSSPVQPSWRDFIRANLPQTILPNLQSINASMQLVCWIIPGRPVTSVVMLSGNNRLYPITTTALGYLALGSVPLLELITDNLEWQLDTFKVIGKLFPKLEKLTAFCTYGSQNAIDNWLAERFSEEISALPNLRSLCVTTLQPSGAPAEKANLEWTLLQQSSTSNPALEEAKFSDHQWAKEDHTWIRTPHGSELEVS